MMNFPTPTIKIYNPNSIKMTPLKTAQKAASIFNTSLENIQRQFRSNADTLESMHKKALSTGKKVNRYTADQLEQMVIEALQRGGVEVVIYKGYQIRTTPNPPGFSSLVYKNADFVAGTVGLDSVEKAMAKIDKRA